MFPFLSPIVWLVISWVNLLRLVSLLKSENLIENNVFYTMGQKAHPIGIRLGKTRRSCSYWYAPKSYYPLFLYEDQSIRKLISQMCSGEIFSDIQVTRRNVPTQHGESINLLRIRILRQPSFPLEDKERYLAQVRIKLLKKCKSIHATHIRHEINKPALALPKITNIKFQIFLREVQHPEVYSHYLAILIVQAIERRTPFRKAIRLREKSVSKTPVVRGIRIQISGRLGGAEIARTEWIRKGQVPLHTICARLDYSSQTAHTTYGLLGVKVWLFKDTTVSYC